MNDEELKRIIEAILFASDQPVSINEMREVLDGADGRIIRTVIERLRDEYEKEKRSFKIVEVAGGFQMATDPLYGEWLKKIYKSRQTNRLSGPALETLAIIAYRQPVTRADIEFIRGVNVDGVIKNLMDRNIIRITGRKDVPGRPILYGTTKEFLLYFGLNSLDELPNLKEFSEADIQLPEKDNKEVSEMKAGEKVEVSESGETAGTD
ncbi:MAG: SMC-Scp complex subunit ScpB [Candidatus Omnitrophica bacterium]|nr:SMC-Scp complex subunit ScpB [Candidatus Omnitrophota bacterium]